MTAWMEVAKLMAAHRDAWSGTLVMIGNRRRKSASARARCWRTACSPAFPSPISRWRFTIPAICLRA
jgi:hippurate hydrolase